MATAPMGQSWDPYTLWEINNPIKGMTCVGTTQQNRRCQQSVNKDKRLEIWMSLYSLAQEQPSKVVATVSQLEKLVASFMCYNHGRQAKAVAQDWQEKLRAWIDARDNTASLPSPPNTPVAGSTSGVADAPTARSLSNAASQDAREAFTLRGRVQRLQARVEQLTLENSNLTREHDRLADDLADLRLERDALQRSVQETEADLAESQDAFNAAQEDHRDELHAVETENAALQRAVLHALLRRVSDGGV